MRVLNERPLFASRRAELRELFEALLRCRSIGPGPELDRAFAIVRDALANVGIESRIVMNRFDVPTLVATLDSGRPGARILLQGHMDVVPVEDDWETDPFTPTLVGETLRARGSCDMKAGIAAFVHVMATAAQYGGLTSGSLTLLLDADEETGSDTGLLPYIEEHGLEGFDWAICGEPTAMRPLLGNRGLIWASIEVRGRAAHAGIPHAGVNPVPVLAGLIAELPEPPAVPGVLGGLGPSMTPTVVSAGEAVNSIPAVAKLLIDRRVVPPEDPREIRRELDEFVAGFARRHPSHTISIDFFKEWPPCLLDEHSDLARVAAEVAQQSGFDADFGFDDPCDDASFISAAGVPTLLWGPGDPEMAHVSNEGIALEQLYAAPEMYWDALVRLGVREA